MPLPPDSILEVESNNLADDSVENIVLDVEGTQNKKPTPTQKKLSERYELLSRLKKPDEEQIAFVKLHAKKNRTKLEEEAYKLACDHQLKILAKEDAILAATESVKNPKENRTAEDHNKVLCGVLLIDFLKKYPEFRQKFEEHADVYFVVEAQRNTIKF